MENRNSTIIVLNYRGYGHVEMLSGKLREQGKHVTMLTDRETNVETECYDEVVRCEDVLDVMEVFTCIELTLRKYSIYSIVNSTSFPAYVYYYAIKKYGDKYGHQNWLMNARIKSECRRILSENGVSPVKYCLVSKEEHLLNVPLMVGFPAVIKPVGGQGSDCVYKVNNYDELNSRYCQIINTAIEGAHPNTCKNLRVNSVNYDLTRDVIVEEYLHGTEYAIDGYIYENEAVIAAIHQKCFGKEDEGFRDVFYISPPLNWTSEDQSKIDTLVNDVKNVLGMNNTLFHIEIRMSNGIPRIVEVNPRIGGGTITENIFMSTGICLIGVFANILCGNQIIRSQPLQRGVVYDFGITIPKAGRVMAIHGYDKIKEVNGIKHTQLYVKLGDEVKSVIGERFAFMCNGQVSSHDEAFAVFDKINKLVSIEMV